MNMNKSALSNLKVLDFSTLLPGPFGTLMLADFGADVLKISSPSRKDLVLDLKPEIESSKITATQAWLNRNKKSMNLNLKTPEAIAIIKDLIKEYDVIMEQFRPGVMEKLGLGYETLKEINPRLIYCSLTGYGQTGPLSKRAGHDINYMSRSGNISHAGKKDGGPSLMNTQIADLAAGAMNCVIGILVALNYRNMTGIGQYIDVGMLDGMIPFNSMSGCTFLVDGIEAERESSLLNGGSAYDFYETKDGEFMSVGSLEPQFWSRFCEGIGRSEWIDGSVYPENIAEIKSELRDIMKEKTRDEWMEIFASRDCCVEAVLNLKEALNEDEHIKARESIVEVPVNEDMKVRQYAMPIKLSESPAQYNHAGYELGKDTLNILKQLGYDDEKIKELEEKGTFL